MDTKYYWENKKQRAEQAKKHTEEMERLYDAEIEYSFQNGEIYGKNFKLENKRKDTNQNIILKDEDSVSAVFNHQDDKAAVLNFASYKNPGGMFLEGSRAQEECLCHESFLYNVLRKYEDSYYAYNRQHLNKGLYEDKAIFSPMVGFIRNNDVCTTDVITCASPNYSVALKYGNFTKEENSQALRERIKFVLDIASDNEMDTLILGAWGCGVFKQDPEEVCQLFLEELKNHKDIRNIVFAVLGKESENYKAFAKYIKKEA